MEVLCLQEEGLWGDGRSQEGGKGFMGICPRSRQERHLRQAPPWWLLLPWAEPYWNKVMFAAFLLSHRCVVFLLHSQVLLLRLVNLRWQASWAKSVRKTTTALAALPLACVLEEACLGDTEEVIMIAEKKQERKEERKRRERERRDQTDRRGNLRVGCSILFYNKPNQPLHNGITSP